MKTPRPTQAFTLIELLVVIAIIAILASLAIPAVTGALVKGQLTQTLNNARQVYLAGFQMATDGTTTGDQKLGWPGDLADPNRTDGKANNISDYVTRMIEYDYLKAGDVIKVFSAPGVPPWNGQGTFANTNSPFKIFLTKESDNASTLFLETANYTYNTMPVATATPYGDKGFVVFRKGGDGSILKKQQATQLTTVGLVPGQADYSTTGDESGKVWDNK